MGNKIHSRFTLYVWWESSSLWPPFLSTIHRLKRFHRLMFGVSVEMIANAAIRHSGWVRILNDLRTEGEEFETRWDSFSFIIVCCLRSSVGRAALAAGEAMRPSAELNGWRLLARETSSLSQRTVSKRHVQFSRISVCLSLSDYEFVWVSVFRSV